MAVPSASLQLTIDINADLGEGVATSRLAEDIRILDLVSSANIACGFHAGDAVSMRETVRAARERGVTIGAHVSYPDMPGFGRREIGLAPEEISHHVAVQIRALSNVCLAEHARVTYVKPHGALYNRAAREPAAARAVARGIVDVNRDLLLLGLAGSEMKRAAKQAELGFISEAFVDRAYNADLQLVPRNQPGALLQDIDLAVDRAVSLVTKRTMTTHDGAELPLEASSLCVHGDSENAFELLSALRLALESRGVRIAPFAS